MRYHYFATPFIVIPITTSSYNCQRQQANNPGSSNAVSYPNEECRLKHDILKKRDIYNTRSKPVHHYVHMRIKLQLVVRAIMDLDETEEVLSLFVWVLVEWSDSYIHWNKADYGGMHYVVFQPGSLWFPTVELTNRAGIVGDSRTLDGSNYKVGMIHDGYSTLDMAGAIRTTCKLKLTYFPFDHQACFIEFSLANCDINFVDFYYAQPVDLTLLRYNMQWEIIHTRAITYKLHKQPKQRSVLYLRRKPLYYVLGLLVPTVTTSLLAPVVHMMRQESEEKLTVQVTLLMSYVVMQFSVCGYLPKTSDNLPLIVIYVFLITILTAISLIITMILQKFHEIEDRPTPSGIVSIALSSIAFVVGFNRRRLGTQEPIVSQEVGEVFPDSYNSNLTEIPISKVSESTFEKHLLIMQCRKEFRQMIRKMDAVFACIFWILVIAATLTLFLILHAHRHDVFEPLEYYREMKDATYIYNDTFGYQQYYADDYLNVYMYK